MRDRARRDGVDSFVGGDSGLIHRCLGARGTKALEAAISAANNQNFSQNYSQNSNRGSSGGYRGNNSGRQPFTGWRKQAAEKGICFRFCQGAPCNGCRFKHLCTHCGSANHTMFNCPNDNRGGGDNKG